MAGEIIRDDGPGLLSLRNKHEDFHTAGAFGRLAHGKRIGGRRSGRINASALEQSPNHHGFRPGAGVMDHNYCFAGRFFAHLLLFGAVTIIL